MMKNKRLTGIEILLILMVFIIAFIGANLLPVEKCPDEDNRRRVTDWIVRTGTLPTGDEQETIVELWGFSYALRPYLTSIIAAIFVKLTSLVTQAPGILTAASRMTSVFSLTACAWFCLMFGHRVFKRRGSAILLAVFVCFNPQVQFLGMYFNNDILSLAAVSSILCFLTEGYEDNWGIRNCVKLAVAFSVLLLSYYSAYGWGLAAVLFIVLAVRNAVPAGQRAAFILRRVLLIAGICLLLAGWFFVRNAVLHQGSFFGILEEKRNAQMLTARGQKLPYVCFRDQGYSVLDFLRHKDGEFLNWTAQSFFGVFGYMDIRLPAIQYGVYYCVTLAGIILYLAAVLRRRPEKRDILLILMMLFASAVTFAMYFWASYARDYQPQGRYIITLALPLGYMLAYGAEHVRFNADVSGTVLRRELTLTPVFIALWLLLFLFALPVMRQMLP